MILGISAALAIGLVATPLLLARGGDSRCLMGMGAGHFGHHGGGFGRVLRDLDLTAEQKTALHGIHDAARDQNKVAKEALHDGLMDAARILLADPNNVEGARTAIANREAAIREMKDNTLTAVSKALAVLTPEQRATLAARLEEHHKEMTR
jgi:Spy/CpxP family protein refolding chaperone